MPTSPDMSSISTYPPHPRNPHSHLKLSNPTPPDPTPPDPTPPDPTPPDPTPPDPTPPDPTPPDPTPPDPTPPDPTPPDPTPPDPTPPDPTPPHPTPPHPTPPHPTPPHPTPPHQTFRLLSRAPRPNPRRRSGAAARKRSSAALPRGCARRASTRRARLRFPRGRGAGKGLTPGAPERFPFGEFGTLICLLHLFTKGEFHLERGDVLRGSIGKPVDTDWLGQGDFT